MDFKSKRINPLKLQNTYVAFANADGGDLYIGIEEPTEAQRVNGFDEPEEANQIIQQLMVSTKPNVEGVNVEFLKTENNGYILHFIIPKSDKVHYNSSGDCYLRMNAQSIKTTGDRITQLAYAKGFYKFEEQLVDAAELDDIVGNPYITDYLERVGSKQDQARFLRRNRLIVENGGNSKPNVACVLLFDEEPQAVLSSKASVKIVRMKTTSSEYKREQLASSEVLVGPLEHLAQRSEEQIFDIMKKSTFMIDGTEVKVSYPVEAVHEILANAFLHRDYSIADDIHVTIYDNRIEIRSPGRLPGNVTVENILDAHFSRNPNIVRLINKLPNPMNHDLGEGLNTAFNAMCKAGLVAPEITEIENSVLVTIHHKKLESYEDQIMEYLKTNEWITNKIARKITGEDSENKVKKALQKLRKVGRIEPEDPDVSRFKYRYRKTTNNR